MIFLLVDKTDAFTKTTQRQNFNNVLSVQRAFVASLHVVQGLQRHHWPRHASHESQECYEPHRTYRKEFQGFLPASAAVAHDPLPAWLASGSNNQQSIPIEERTFQLAAAHRSATLYWPTLKFALKEETQESQLPSDNAEWSRQKGVNSEVLIPQKLVFVKTTLIHSNLYLIFDI